LTKREPSEWWIERKAIEIAESGLGVRLERIGRRAEVIDYLEKMAKGSNVTTL